MIPIYFEVLLSRCHCNNTLYNRGSSKLVCWTKKNNGSNKPTSEWSCCTSFSLWGSVSSLAKVSCCTFITRQEISLFSGLNLTYYPIATFYLGPYRLTPLCALPTLYKIYILLLQLWIFSLGMTLYKAADYNRGQHEVS